MVKRKNIRTRGKLRLSKYFQNLKAGDRVAVIKEKSVSASFPLKLQGLTGEVETARGSSYIVKIKEKNKEKKFIIAPIHLKKIQ